MKTLKLFVAALAMMVAGSAMAQNQANPSATPQKENKPAMTATKPAMQTPPAPAKKADPTMSTTTPGQGTSNAGAKQERHQSSDKMMAEHAGGEKHAAGTKHMKGSAKGKKADVKKGSMQEGTPAAQPVK
jgi:hypothetical protein